MLGPDVYPFPGGGTHAQLSQFRVETGSTYPLLQRCGDGSSSSDTNLTRPYIGRHNFVVINKQGIIRYHARQRWPYGNAYHRDELRGAIDSLVTSLAGVGERPAAVPALAAAPNPFRSSTVIELGNPGVEAASASIDVLDLAGRRVARPWSGLAAPGITRVRWDGRGVEGPLPPGVYLIRAEVGKAVAARRVAIVR